MPPSDSSRAPRWTEITAVAGAMVAAGIATVAVVGWNIGVEPLIAVQAGYIPLQYNTALGLLGCALSLLALLRGRRWLSTAAAGAVTLLSSAMAVEYIGEMDVGIDTLFFNRIVADHISGRMAPNTVAAFLCVSLALLLLTWQHRIRGASGLAVSLAAFVAAVGSVGLTGYLAKIPSAYQWRAQTPIAVLTTLGFLALAAATIAAAWDSRRDRSSALPSWLPAPVFVFLMSVCGMIARATWATSRMPVLPQARRSLVFSTVQMLLFGAAVSVALAGVIRMAQAAQRRSRELSLLNAALDVEVERRCREQAVTEGLNRALRLICACNHAIAHAEDEPELLRRICELAVEIGGYPLAWIGFAEDEGERLVRAVAKAGPAADYIQDGSVTWAEDARGRGPTGAAIRTGRVCRCDSMLIDSDFRPWRDRAQEFGFRSSLAVPLLQGGAAFGALSIYACVTDAFAEAELELFTQLGNDLAFGIDALRTRAARDRAERELRQASLYARSLLEASLDPLVTISREGKITDVNAATEAVTGAPRNALIGTDFSTYFTEPERASAAYQRVFAEGMVKDYPLAMRDG